MGRSKRPPTVTLGKGKPKCANNKSPEGESDPPLEENHSGGETKHDDTNEGSESDPNYESDSYSNKESKNDSSANNNQEATTTERVT